MVKGPSAPFPRADPRGNPDGVKIGMSEIAFWSFEDGPAEGGGVAGEAASGGRLVLEEAPQWPGQDTQEQATLETGTLKLEFSLPPATDSAASALLSLGTGADARLELSVSSSGQVVLAHDDGARAHQVQTPEGFCFPGDDLRLTYGWGPDDEGAGFTVENLTTDAHHHAPVPPGLTLSLDDDPEAALAFSAQSDARFDYVALYDHAEPAGPLAAHVQGEPALPDLPAADDVAEPGAMDAFVHLTFEGGDAERAHLFGHYQVDPQSGGISAVMLDFADTRPEFAGGELIPGVSQASAPIAPEAEIGAFLVLAGGEANDLAALGEGEFAFLNERGEPATMSDSAPRLWHLGADGTATELSGEVWHSAGHGATAALNSDATTHLKGISENSDGTWSFGFHDSDPNEGPSEAAQLLFTVDLGSSGARFLNPDLDARAPLGADATDDAWTLFSDEEEEGEDALAVQAHAGVPWTTTVRADVAADPAAPVSASLATAPEDEEGDATDKDDKGDDDDKKIVPCFTAGTLIETDEGRIPVEELFAGDRVLTRDHGYRRLVWVGHKEVSLDLMRTRPDFAPVRIARGALDGALPERDMLVSPQHRMLISGWRAELMFGVSEVLVPARHLIGRPGITRAHDTPVTYVHIMCDRHEIVRADGCWSESFQPGDMSLAGLDGDQRAELLALFPELVAIAGQRDYAAARMTLKAYEVRAMFNL